MSLYNGVLYAAEPPGTQTHDPSAPWHAGSLVGVTAVFLPAAALATGVRLYTRACIVGSLAADDYLMMIAMCLSVVMTTFNLNMLNYGLGKDLWNVPMQPDFYPHFNFNNLMAAIFFCAATGLAKGSILLFYLRIFPMRKMKMAVWSVFTFTIGYSLASVFVNIFSCNPVTASWVFAEATSPTTTCINRPVFYFAQAGLGIVADVATVLLPLPVLKWLRLPRKQKIAVAVVLNMGASVCVVSIIRLQSLNVLLSNPNLTGNTVDALMWCVLELNLSIIGGSIPTVKPFVQRLVPRLIDASTRGASKSGDIHLKNTSAYYKRSTGQSGTHNSQKDTNSMNLWGRGSAAKNPVLTTTITGTNKSGSEEYIMIDQQAITKTVEYGFYQDHNRGKQGSSAEGKEIDVADKV